MNNIELISHGLKCDNPNCDWVDQTIQQDDYSEWINAKCPKCNENVLTLEDYENAMALKEVANLINSFTPEELHEMTKGVDVETLKEEPFLKDAKGLENLSDDIEKKCIISFNTHKEIKIREIKAVQDEEL